MNKKQTGVKLLKVTPELAVNSLREMITAGYGIRWKNEGNVFDRGLLSKKKELNEFSYEREVADWGRRVCIDLMDIFASKIESYKFTYSGIDNHSKALSLYENADSTRDELLAKIKYLESCLDLVMNSFTINITANRDVNIQTGHNSKMKVTNKNE